jgi:hypothetical protein
MAGDYRGAEVDSHRQVTDGAHLSPDGRISRVWPTRMYEESRWLVVPRVHVDQVVPATETLPAPGDIPADTPQMIGVQDDRAISGVGRP